MRIKTLLGHSAMLLALKILTSLLALVFHFMLARQLDIAEFGLFSLAASCLMFTSALAKQGLEQSIVRRVAQDSHGQNEKAQDGHGQLGGLYRFVLLYSGCMALIIATCLYALADTLAIGVFKQPALAELLPMTAALTLIQTWLAINSAMLKGRSHALVSMLFTGAVTFSLVLLMFYVCPPHSALSAIEQLTMAAALACALSFMVTLLKVKPKIPLHKFNGKTLLTSNAWLFISVLGALVTQQLAILMLGRYATLEQVGLFSIGMKVSMVLSYPLLAVNGYTAPQYARLGAAGAFGALRQLATSARKILLVVGSVGALLLFAFAETIAGYLGQQYLPAAEIIRILLLGQWVNLATGSVVSILLMNGYEKLHSRNSLLIMLVNIAALLVWVPSYGIIAAAWVTSIMMASKNLLSWYYVNKLVYAKADNSP